jgi:DNA topoisomerase-1
MTWDVPVKDDCPECGMTMFKKSGKGFKKPFCINDACSKFVPEDKRGYRKKTAENTEGSETTQQAEKSGKKPAKPDREPSGGKSKQGKTKKADG